ncbi:hypothetical protein T548_0063 [Lactococcus phage phiL47]|uniref:Uncharacterized protein n=1 Tax=Lactococcus phage phiL47 TaxID=1412875 RepID=V9VD53_9CAUD|nr:hypothetical protein T548_0063 [Lactococcus phage phiL47]AHC94141.1 hypothetical protein T548_0063 [Lactococcus phage phiL47]
MVKENGYVVYKTWYPKIFGFTYFIIRDRNIYNEELLKDTTPIIYTDDFDIATNIVRRLREEYKRS